MITLQQLDIFKKYPVIAAVRTPEDIEKALLSKVNILFMVGGDFFQAEYLIKKFKRKDTLVFLHMDLIEGIGKDLGGIRYAVRSTGIDGVISTKSHMIKTASKEGLITVHRIFLMDNQAFESGIKMFQESKSDIIELTPGLMPRIVRQVNHSFKPPVITSGLIAKPNDVTTMLNAGAMNIVCTRKELWNL